MPNKKLVQKKLEEIVQQLGYLEDLVKLKQIELFGNPQKLYFAERVMERLIGSAIDINMHLAASLGGKVPEDYFESFLELAVFKIFPLSFAKRIAPSTSLRNILVHEYQSLDLKKFQSALRHGLREYRQYARYVERYLNRD